MKAFTLRLTHPDDVELPAFDNSKQRAWVTSILPALQRLSVGVLWVGDQIEVWGLELSEV